MARFLPAFDFMLPNETGGRADGGYTNDRLDPGGETRWGVAKRSHPGVDVFNLTRAGACEIYRREYWDAMPGLDMVASQTAASKIFDAAVHMGTRGGAICAQRTIADLGITVKADGILGQLTAQAINGFEERDFVIAFVRRLMQTYEIICARNGAAYTKRYFNGFMNRARRLP